MKQIKTITKSVAVLLLECQAEIGVMDAGLNEIKNLINKFAENINKTQLLIDKVESVFILD